MKSNTFSEGESITVKLQEESEMSYSILSGIPVVVESFVFIKDMLSHFD